MSANNYRTQFGFQKRLLVVVHVTSIEQAVAQADIAFDNGANGIFLIEHVGIGHDKLLTAYGAVRQKYLGNWIGLNFLDVQDPFRAIMLCNRAVSGLWRDNAGIDEDADDPAGRAARVHEYLKKPVEHEHDFHGTYFGGVAFKYHRPPRDPGRCAKLAMPYVDVVTTSGDATGLAPNVTKIHRMRDAIGDHPLAIASGVSVDNIHLFLPHVDCFLVASSLETTQAERVEDPSLAEGLCPDKVRVLADIIRAY